MFYLHNEQPIIMRMNALLLHVTAQLNLTNIILIKIKPDTKEFLLSVSSLTCVVLQERKSPINLHANPRIIASISWGIQLKKVGTGMLMLGLHLRSKLKSVILEINPPLAMWQQGPHHFRCNS